MTTLKQIKVTSIVKEITSSPTRAATLAAWVAKIAAMKGSQKQTAKLFFQVHPSACKLTADERAQIQAA